MTLHSSTFEYLSPKPRQLEAMGYVRVAFTEFVSDIDAYIPDGPDKTYLLRKLRECAMWANVAITRNPDGSLRD